MNENLLVVQLSDYDAEPYMPHPKKRRSSVSEVVFERIGATTGYQRVAESIEKQILAGKLIPGDVLPTEYDLAIRLGVNRSTIREGIRLLENTGLVKRAGGKKLVISVPAQGALTWSTTRALTLGRTTFQELWEIQMRLEPLAAALAAERATEEIVDALASNIERTRKSLDDDAALISCDVQFHELIAKGAANWPLALAAAPIGQLLLAATKDLYKRAPRASSRLLEAHTRIFEAIRARDVQTSELWMEKHIRDFKVGYRVAGLDMGGPLNLDSIEGLRPGRADTLP